jgi:hypothetical protein
MINFINFSEEELQQYTKDELIFYLMKIQPYIPNYKTESIKDIILWKRYKEINEKIDKVLADSTELAKKYNDTFDLKILVKLQSLNKERDKLWKKEKKMQKELFGV